jgi:glycine betaine/choline ABC-type transport system substrate-binding protein
VLVSAAVGLAVLGIAAGCSSSSSTIVGPTSTVSGARGIAFRFKALDSGGPATVDALRAGTVEVAQLPAFSPAISRYGWVVLTDDQDLAAADDFAPAMRAAKVTPAINRLLAAVDARLTHDEVAAMVDQVANHGASPAAVAKTWLERKGVPGPLRAAGSITVGTSNVPESEIVGQMYAQALQKAGADVTVKPDVGGRQATTQGLEGGTLDLVPELTTSLLTYLNPDAVTSSDAGTTYTSVRKAAAKKGIAVLAPSLLNRAQVFVVTPATAAKYHLRTVSDLARVSTALTLGGPPTCPHDPQCLIGLERVYGIPFSGQ